MHVQRGLLLCVHLSVSLSVPTLAKASLVLHYDKGIVTGFNTFFDNKTSVHKLWHDTANMSSCSCDILC